MIGAGWLVVYRNSLRIEARKDARDFLEQIESNIDSLQGNIVKYYVDNEQHIGHLSAQIKADFQLLSQHMFILKGFGIKVYGSDILTQYRKSSTGGYFETVDFRKQRDIPGWDADLSSLSAQLKLALRRSYHEWTKAYSPPKLPTKQA